MAQSPHCAGLKSLRLNNNNIGDHGATALARSTTLAQLESLYLENENWIHALGIKAMAESKNLASLRRLVLTLNVIGDEGAIYLANSQHLSGLHFLNVAGNKLSPKGEDALQKTTALTNLKVLEIV